MKQKSFSEEGYISILELAKKNGYTICGIKDAAAKKQKNPVLILRHDVDMHLEIALSMAKLEHKLGVKSTYLILLYNDYYNPLSPKGRELIKEILNLGHEIGIHWDSRDYKVEAEKTFKRDLEILSEITGTKILSGSQHEPTLAPLMKIFTSIRFESYRDFKDYVYVSDSSMRWRQYTPWDLIDKKQNIQFLAHPFWWMTGGKTRKQKFSYFHSLVSDIYREKLNKYDRDLNAFLKIRGERDKYFGFKNKKLSVS